MSSIFGTLLSLSVIVFLVKAERARSVSAIFIFGDSTADPGNNNGLNTIFKCNFLPYGRDFPTHQPTGRFCNGRLVTDFIAEELGLKETVPAYLDPQLKTQDLLTGVSYASSAAGYDDLTAHNNKAVPIWQQVEYFKAHVEKLKKVVGEKNASDIVRNALYGISIGSNDILDNYFLLPIRRKEFSVEQYQDFLVKKAEDFTKELYHLGARKLGVFGLPPLGCLPVERSVRLQTTDVRPCVEKLNQVAMTYNEKLQAVISNLKPKLPGMMMVLRNQRGDAVERDW
ncbi:hypothetical protein SUGI_0760750 [Cryptomeria japonica]|nr:hypothetical protein SUGI_0760750 [Cryptomeria japonica]